MLPVNRRRVNNRINSVCNGVDLLFIANINQFVSCFRLNNIYPKNLIIPLFSCLTISRPNCPDEPVTKTLVIYLRVIAMKFVSDIFNFTLRALHEILRRQKIYSRTSQV